MGISYVRGYRDPHKGLHIWTVIARKIRGLVVLRVPMHVPNCYKKFKYFGLTDFIFKFYGHFLLITRIRNNCFDTILIREFLTLPLLMVSPFLYHQRSQLLFLCQHNIAYANSKMSHRLILKCLRNLGFRFVLYENVTAWQIIESKHNSSKEVFSIPLPFPARLIDTKRTRATALITIGFVGNFRKEKSPTWALDALTKAVTTSQELVGCSLLVGTPDAEFRNNFAQFAHVIDTSSYGSFVTALRACDVIVLPYEPESYAYRSSGVLAEAVAYGCAVVVPDLPTLRDQVFFPAAVGACYASQDDFVAAVKLAVSMVRTGEIEAAVQAHYALRGPQGVRAALVGLMK